jgi:hypothetical protein
MSFNFKTEFLCEFQASVRQPQKVIGGAENDGSRNIRTGKQYLGLKSSSYCRKSLLMDRSNGLSFKAKYQKLNLPDQDFKGIPGNQS